MSADEIKPMSPADLRVLADWHEKKGQGLFDLAKAFTGDHESEVRADGMAHVTWAAMLRELAVQLANGTAMGAKVIEAGEHSRRELLVRVAALTAEIARFQKNGRSLAKILAEHVPTAKAQAASAIANASFESDVLEATSADFAGAVFLTPGMATRLRQLAAACVSSEFSAEVIDILGRENPT